jgi:hypothetical protein
LAPVQEKSPYVAANEAVASVFHGLITLAGGFFFDWLNDGYALSRFGLAAISPLCGHFRLGTVVTPTGGATGNGPS